MVALQPAASRVALQPVVAPVQPTTHLAPACVALPKPPPMEVAVKEVLPLHAACPPSAPPLLVEGVGSPFPTACAPYAPPLLAGGVGPPLPAARLAAARREVATLRGLPTL